MSRFFKNAFFPIFIVVVLAFFAQRLIGTNSTGQKHTLGEFLAQVQQTPNEFKSIDVKTKTNEISITEIDKTHYTVGYPQAFGDDLVNRLETIATKTPGFDERYNVEAAKSNGWLSLLTYILPFIIFIGFWIFLMNQVQGGGSKVMSFGKSRAKRLSVDSPKITFRDVAGVDEAVEELHEIKEFLENPKKFQALGARIPKGVLL